MKLFKDGKVVTGDGKTVHEKATVVVVDDVIADVLERVDPSLDGYADEVVDCSGKCVVPGDDQSPPARRDLRSHVRQRRRELRT